jgi:hypothetical protein
MSFGYGFSLPNWLSLSAGGTPTPPANFAVLPAAGTPTYTVTRNVLSSSGAVFAVPATVLSSGGTSYTPI